MTSDYQPTSQNAPSEHIAECLPTILSPPAAWEAVLPLMKLRERVEDFEVEEVPAYLPDGNGQHLYLWVEKTDTAAAELLARFSRHLKIALRDMGVAGQKDRRAVTRQFVSVPRECESRLADFCDNNIRILSISAHGNKLRTGHLTGNRFRITLRPDASELSSQTAHDAGERLAEIQQRGFPNYFGPQRFGIGGCNIHDGIELLRAPEVSRRWNPKKRRFMKKMLPSAVQSGVFNMVLAQRVADQTFRTPGEGDVVCSKTGIRPFLLSDASPELKELVPMGPMPGPKMMQTSSPISVCEEATLEKLNLTAASFVGTGKHTPGARRRMVSFPQDTAVERQPDGSLQLNFTLGPGSYATVLIDQLGPTQESR